MPEEENLLQIQDPESQTRGLEKIKQAADRLKRNKQNAVFQTKRIFVLEMFIGFNEKNLVEKQAEVKYFEDRISINKSDLDFSKKSLETSTQYVYEHGDDEDKQKLSESLLKKVQAMKKKLAEMEEMYKAELVKEQKK